MLLALMARTGFPAERVLMVGDTEYDLEMAARAGVDALGVTWGAHPAARLRSSGPIDCLDDLRELADWLAGEGAQGTR